MISIKNLTFGYNDQSIIEELSLSVAKGTWLGLIGPNGAGKTTLIKLISGYLKCPGGEIVLEGLPISSYSRKEMGQLLAVVPQASRIAFSFTAGDVVLMGRFPYLKRFCLETKEDLAIVKEAMLTTDTWQFKNRPIDELSGGEHQRVLIARALATAPKILLLDEPTTFLDIKHQIEIMNLLRKLNLEEGLTILSALHDINLAISYCSEIAMMDGGRIQKWGKPEKIVTYANLKEIFGAEVYVGINELTGKPYYLPMKT